MTDFHNLVELLHLRAQQEPKKCAYTFLVDGETEVAHLTYGELDRQARAIGALLQQLQLQGTRALLLYPPGLEYIAAFFGCLYASVVAVPAYPPRPNRSMARLQAIAQDAQATVALTTTSICSHIGRQLSLAPELSSLHWLSTDNIDSSLVEKWQAPIINKDTLAFLQYTSGSTAVPKGVMVTHGNILYNQSIIHNCFEHTTESHGVIWLPPYHDMGLIGGVLQPLYGNFPVTLMSPTVFLQRPLRWLQAISRYKATTSGGPNFAYELCLRKVTPEQLSTLDLSSWSVAFNGAEPIRHDTLERFAETFALCGFRAEAFYPCYGMAETTLIVSGGSKATLPVLKTVEKEALLKHQIVTNLKTDSTAQVLVSCGRSLLDQQIFIVHPEKLTRCQSNEVGEIWISGSSVSQGYWNRPEETEATFGAYLADTGEGPFLRTGDLGFLHQEELFITGRLKDLIIIRGRNHYPQDIERTVEQSHPALRLGCVAAFTFEVDGEEQLVIVQEVERHYRECDVQEIIGNIRQAVAATHELQVYAVLLLKTGSIPKTSSGKIQRHACRVGFLSNSLDVVSKHSKELFQTMAPLVA